MLGGRSGSVDRSLTTRVLGGQFSGTLTTLLVAWWTVVDVLHCEPVQLQYLLRVTGDDVEAVLGVP